jgi:hypothetical protein
MAAWDRKTPWRQGHALTNEAALELGLVPEKAVATAVVMEDGSAMNLELLATGKREILKDRFAGRLPNAGVEVTPNNRLGFRGPRPVRRSQ